MDYLDKGHTITEAFADLLIDTGENQADSAWTDDKSSALPPGNALAHVHSGLDCYPEMWIPTC